MPANTARHQTQSTEPFETEALAGNLRGRDDKPVFDLERISILVIEDDDSDAELISEILGRTKHVERIVRAVDGREALDIVADGAFRPDLILLDLNMPRMDGFEFLTNARDNTMLRGVPVVVLTTSARYADVRQALRGTASSYIVKPESVSELKSKIEKVLASIARGDYLERRI